MQLLECFGWLLRCCSVLACCYAVAWMICVVAEVLKCCFNMLLGCFGWLLRCCSFLACCYAVAWMFWVVAKVL